MSNRMPSIAIDFDGVIHEYSEGWKDGTCYDKPRRYAFNSLRKLLKHYYVFILSTRQPQDIADWLTKHKPPFRFEIVGEIVPGKPFWNKKGIVGITNRKLGAQYYIDDRAVPFDATDEHGWLSVMKVVEPKGVHNSGDKVGK